MKQYLLRWKGKGSFVNFTFTPTEIEKQIRAISDRVQWASQNGTFLDVSNAQLALDFYLSLKDPAPSNKKSPYSISIK